MHAIVLYYHLSVADAVRCVLYHDRISRTVCCTRLPTRFYRVCFELELFSTDIRASISGRLQQGMRDKRFRGFFSPCATGEKPGKQEYGRVNTDAEWVPPSSGVLRTARVWYVLNECLLRHEGCRAVRNCPDTFGILFFLEHCFAQSSRAFEPTTTTTDERYTL